MAKHEAIFINKESKNGYRENETRTIVVVRTSEKKLMVISSPGPASIVYDKDEDFYKDWRIVRRYAYEGKS